VRWFVIFLLLANIALYFWVQQQSRPATVPDPLTAPDVGNLRLLRDELTTGMAARSDTRPPGQSADPSVDSFRNGADVATPEASVADAGPDSGSAGLPVSEGLEPTPVAADMPSPQDNATTETQALPAEIPQRLPAVSTLAAEAEKAVVDAEDTATGLTPRVAKAPAEPKPTVSPTLPEVAQPAAIDGGAAADAQVQPAMVCAKLGPLADDQVETLAGSLPEGVRVLDDVSETYRKVDGYYVMIPPLPNLAEGRLMLQRLKDAGITDTWLFRSGENRNAISLGLFTRKSGAERHAADIAGKGFSPEVRERNREFEGRFLVIGTTAAGPAGLGVDLPESVGLAEVNCPKP
jgi:hypothetical protein